MSAATVRGLRNLARRSYHAARWEAEYRKALQAREGRPTGSDAYHLADVRARICAAYHGAWMALAEGNPKRARVCHRIARDGWKRFLAGDLSTA